MIYRGHIKNGSVVLDQPVMLPEGAAVEVAVLSQTAEATGDDEGPTLNERLASVIGKAENLPPDASINHDHYLYGTPNR